MLLAGDVGGTNTRLGLFERRPDRPRIGTAAAFRTLNYDSLGDMVSVFLDDVGLSSTDIEAAAFGVAGPVIDDAARLTNVPWRVDAGEVRDRVGIDRVGLLNDLVAMGHAVSVLEGDELAVLQEGQATPTGNAALIAAGTGLGEALLLNVDGRFLPCPSEGGHADFAPRTAREIELLQELVRSYGRADVERVVSGPGLVNLFRFTHGRRPCQAVDPHTDPNEMPALISTSARRARCPLCVETLDLFVSAYGAESGNLALRALATAGVYVGGGIAPRILPALETGAFLAAFRAKEPMVDLLASIPLAVILNEEAGLLGAAMFATGLAG
jgi:glucokinase